MNFANEIRTADCYEDHRVAGCGVRRRRPAGEEIVQEKMVGKINFPPGGSGWGIRAQNWRAWDFVVTDALRSLVVAVALAVDTALKQDARRLKAVDLF